VPQREIRYIGCPWQVMSLPDGSKEFAFHDPDGITVHILPLPKAVAEAVAAQLRGVTIAPADSIPGIRAPEHKRPDEGIDPGKVVGGG
jgi:hypothetical protein